MNPLSSQMLFDFWSPAALQINLVIFLNLLGALVLGCLVGYERAYHGRAAGMRTYGLVCMASAALTVIAGYSVNWYGGHAVPSALGGDPTRIIQGIVTGIGFLGAGVIMREEGNVRGLNTAATLWTSAAVGACAGAVGRFGQRQTVGVVLQPHRALQQRLQVVAQRLAVERR